MYIISVPTIIYSYCYNNYYTIGYLDVYTPPFFTTLQLIDNIF